MRRLAAIVLGLVVSVSAATCVSTPMPIPPSVDVGLIMMEQVEPTPECMEECIMVRGFPGATDPGVHVAVHRVRAMPMDMPVSESVTADPAGGFSLLLGGAPVGVFRAVFHNDAGSVVIELVPRTEDPPPWPMEEAPPELDGFCMGLSVDAVDFGTVSLGDVETTVVDIRNNCDVEMQIGYAYVEYELWEFEPEPTIWALARSAVLAPGDTAGIVVGFWPIEEGVSSGALIVEVLDMPGTEVTVLSLPVRGEAAD